MFKDNKFCQLKMWYPSKMNTWKHIQQKINRLTNIVSASTMQLKVKNLLNGFIKILCSDILTQCKSLCGLKAYKVAFKVSYKFIELCYVLINLHYSFFFVFNITLFFLSIQSWFVWIETKNVIIDIFIF